MRSNIRLYLWERRRGNVQMIGRVLALEIPRHEPTPRDVNPLGRDRIPAHSRLALLPTGPFPKWQALRELHLLLAGITNQLDVDRRRTAPCRPPVLH